MVQVKRNVWLELLPTGKGFQNLLPKVGGVIGEAVSVMTEAYVEEMFRSVSPVSSAPANRLKPCKVMMRNVRLKAALRIYLILTWIRIRIRMKIYAQIRIRIRKKMRIRDTG